MKPKEALQILNISRQTLSNYVREGKINVIIKSNKQYDYVDEDVYKLEKELFKKIEGTNIDDKLENDLLSLIRSFEKKILHYQKMKRIHNQH